jgi:hypothetical protein
MNASWGLSSVHRCEADVPRQIGSRSDAGTNIGSYKNPPPLHGAARSVTNNAKPSSTPLWVVASSWAYNRKVEQVLNLAENRGISPGLASKLSKGD